MDEKIEIKTNCFAIKEVDKIGNLITYKCTALNDLYCRKEKCNFYKTKAQVAKEAAKAEKVK